MISSLVKLILGIVFIIFVVVVGPVIGIWSLNTLFPILTIPYTLETWAAFALLFGSATGLRFGVNRK